MTVSVFAAFKTAVIDALKADAGVAALVDVRVYDLPPRDPRGTASDTKPPYIYCGPLNWRSEHTACAFVGTARLRLYFVSTDFGRDQAWRVHDAVILALAWKEFSLSGGHLMTGLRPVLGGDVTAPTAPKETFIDFETILSSADAY